MIPKSTLKQSLPQNDPHFLFQNDPEMILK